MVYIMVIGLAYFNSEINAAPKNHRLRLEALGGALSGAGAAISAAAAAGDNSRRSLDFDSSVRGKLQIQMASVYPACILKLQRSQFVYYLKRESI